MSRHLFISDLHLAPERPDIIELFIGFLNDQAAQAESLYILGDLVEYWLGDDDNALGLSQAFDAMKQLADSGVKIYLMQGNRDFLMGEKLAARCGCSLIHEPYIAHFDNTPVLLLHGDILCTDDLRYQELRLMLRNPAWQADFLSKPLAERQQMALALRKQSQEETQLKSSDIMDVNEDAVNQAFISNDIRLMIHGHTHRPAVHDLQINQQHAQRVVLGDWYSQGSVLEFNSPQDFQLKSFK